MSNVGRKIRIPLVRRFQDGSTTEAADVIELGSVKQLLYRLNDVAGRDGLKQRRQGEYLYVFRTKDAPGEYSGFYAAGQKYPTDDAIGRLYIDEGMYERAIVVAEDDAVPAVSVQGVTHAWREYCDYIQFMALLSKLLLPEFTVAPSPYVGNGYTRDHFFKQYSIALLKVVTDRVEFFVLD
jgi:hypothetical protein